MDKGKQEFLLWALVCSDKQLREKALLSVAAHERHGVRKLVDVRRDAEVLLQILMTDLGFASGELSKNYSNQFWRRTAIRTLCATVDGIVFCLKRLAFADAGITQFSLTDAENFLLTEQQPATGKRPRFYPFSENIKETFGLFAKIHKTTCATIFGTQGFEDLCKTYELRNRIMHPKSSTTFSIQDAETKRAGAALAWLHTELNRLLDDSSKSVHPPPAS